MDILTLFTCFETLSSATAIRRLAIIAQAMLTMTGWITMLSLSRWTTKGGSYRTIQRLFATPIDWSEMLVKFFQRHLFNPDDEHILAGDATNVMKAGSRTHGIGFFFWNFGASGQEYRVLCLFIDQCSGAQIVSALGQTNNPQ